jgi:hypothetical protein
MKMTNKLALKISSAYLAFFVLLIFASMICDSSWCEIREDGIFGTLLFTLAPLFPIFVFSLVTYKMRDQVFHAWWNFARWWAPVIVVVTLLLNNASGTGGGYIGMGQDFIFLIQGILYAILVIVSLVKIVRAYSKK